MRLRSPVAMSHAEYVSRRRWRRRRRKGRRIIIHIIIYYNIINATYIYIFWNWNIFS
jgi:hypothetical protein